MSESKAQGLMFLVTLVAAAGWLFTKQALLEFLPFSFLGLRFSLAAMVIALFCLPALWHLTRAQWLRASLLGVLFASALLLWIYTMSFAKSIGIGAFIVSLAALLVPFVSRVLFKRALDRKVLLALIPAAAALLCFISDAGWRFNAVQLGFFVSACVFALHIAVLGELAKSIPSLPLTAIQLFWVGFAGLIVSLLRLENNFYAVAGLQQLPGLNAWLWLLASALIATSLRFAMQTKALAHIDAAKVSLIFVLEPVWTLMLGIVFLGEQLTFLQGLACALVLLALCVYRLQGLFLRPS